MAPDSGRNGGGGEDLVLMKVGQHRGGWGRVTVWASQGCGADGGTLVRGCEGSGGERGGGGDAGEPHTRATERSAGGGKKEDGGGGEAQNGGGGSGGDGGGGVNGGARTDGDEIDGGEGWGCMAAADARTFVVLAHWHSTSSSATCVRAGTAGVISRAPGGAVLAAAGIAAEYGGELYPRTCPAMSSTPLLAGEAGISATLESGRTMSWATPVRSHVVVTTMARSITVERSVPALLGLARVSGEGMGTARVFCCIRAWRWTSKNFCFFGISDLRLTGSHAVALRVVG